MGLPAAVVYFWFIECYYKKMSLAVVITVKEKPRFDPGLSVLFNLFGRFDFINPVGCFFSLKSELKSVTRLLEEQCFTER